MGQPRREVLTLPKKYGPGDVFMYLGDMLQIEKMIPVTKTVVRVYWVGRQHENDFTYSYHLKANGNRIMEYYPELESR